MTSFVPPNSGSGQEREVVILLEIPFFNKFLSVGIVEQKDTLLKPVLSLRTLSFTRRITRLSMIRRVVDLIALVKATICSMVPRVIAILVTIKELGKPGWLKSI